MSSPIALQELFKAGFEDFVIPSYETAPFTTIQNRAQVTRSLKAIAGIERVHVKGLNRLENEFGPNGEQVFEAENKDARIRFVGSWNGDSNANGARATTIVTDDYLEITFYGTGLNGLFAVTSTMDARISVDGGVEGANFFPVSASNILLNRNYSANTLLNLTSGLSVGWHTVKIRNNNVNGISFHGFEILNQRTDLAVYAGAGISNGSFNGLSSLSTSAFNQGVTGTRGARVVKYIENGTIKSSVQEVDATSKYLTLSDHTNEEVVRRINFREFGANRADDFSTVSGAAGAKAFTLDDGVTSLVTNDSSEGNSVGQPDYIGVNTTGGFLTLTFVGTGLDLVSTYTGTSPVAGTLSIDGTTIYTGTFTSFESTSIRTIKIASGLPYGTHTFRYAKTAAGSGLGIGDFIIYQPKKPSIPAGALEVSDYNLMANFTYNGSTSGDVMSQGILRKQNIREYTYVGTWAAPVLSGSYMSGWASNSATVGSYFEYTFFGTGVVYRFGNNAGAQSFTVSMDGSSNLSSFTTTLTATAGFALTAATGVVTGSPAAGVFANSLMISGLPLGVHKIRVAYTSGLGMGPHGTEVITPIHINNSNLKVGNQSLKSVVKYSPEKSVSNAGPDLSKAKAWWTIDMVNNRILASHNVSAALRVGTGQYQVFFEKPFKNKNYAYAGAGEYSQRFPTNGVASIRTDSIGLTTTNTSAGIGDSERESVIIFGELIDE